jgi:hypothetical protein
MVARELNSSAHDHFMHSTNYYWVEQKIFAFLKRWHKQTKKFFYKTRIEKLVTRETVIASNGNDIMD